MRQNPMTQLRKQREETKKQLSESETAEILLDYNNKEHTIVITRQEFETMNMDLLDEL